MDNCNVCKFKSVNTLENNFLCMIHGPMHHTTICKEFEKDETKIKARKCNDCVFFKTIKNNEDATVIRDKGSMIGTCLKYLLREYDGNTRSSCSQFLDKVQKNIAKME